MFYTLNQNNSGGYHIINNDVDVFVIIEANNIEEFKSRAAYILSSFRSYCACCGKRWDDDWIDEDDGTEFPMIYDKRIEDFNDEFWNRNSKVKIYYLNGKRDTFNLETRKYE